MSATYNTQGYLTIRLDTGISLATATDPKIVYIKPNGAKGEWVATISGTHLEYAAANDTFDVVGQWSVQAYVLIDGRNAFGKIAAINIAKKL